MIILTVQIPQATNQPSKQNLTNTFPLLRVAKYLHDIQRPKVVRLRSGWFLNTNRTMKLRHFFPGPRRWSKLLVSLSAMSFSQSLMTTEAIPKVFAPNSIALEVRCEILVRYSHPTKHRVGWGTLSRCPGAALKHRSYVVIFVNICSAKIPPCRTKRDKGGATTVNSAGAQESGHVQRASLARGATQRE